MTSHGDRGEILYPHANRREFLNTVAIGGAAVAMLAPRPPRATAAGTVSYPEWVAPSPKPPKRGGTLTRASSWDPPVIDPRLTQSIGLFQFAVLTSRTYATRPRWPFGAPTATGRRPSRGCGSTSRTRVSLKAGHGRVRP
jgi:hypothetical protein